MAALREIRVRIKNANNMQKITKAMKMVSVSKLRKVQLAMEAARPFRDKCLELAATLSAEDASSVNPLAAGRSEVKRVLYVLMLGNRGLCGSYNHNMLQYMTGLAAGERLPFSVAVCGRWGKDSIRDAGFPVETTFEDIDDTPGAAQGVRLAEYLKEMYLSGGADRIVIVRQRFVNALIQIPHSFQLLPVGEVSPGGEAGEHPEDRQYIFDPDRETILDSVLRLYINSAVYSALLEAKAGEHAARMRAMTSATDNTSDLIAELKLELNHVRQAAITTEISEIVGGASSLRKKKKDNNQGF